ncbi:MAG TPA: hypothetical protein VJ598_10840, partial [Albitalea sp.]|nr:hypothetical protein [Albitalea sp.]
NLIPFAYDWRLSNRVAAQALKALVDRRLAAYRRATNNPLAKVILIAHSMGGLVSRYWLEVLGGWHDCRALVTFGTPYRGSLDALNYLANGFKKEKFSITLLDLSEVVRSCPAAYELLPFYDVLKVGDKWVTPSSIDKLPEGIHRDYLLAARDFHADIDRAIEANRRLPEYLAKPYPIFPVVGVHQATLNSAVLDHGKLVPSELRPDWLAKELEGGDGTVPRCSASPDDRADELREIFFAERHASLQGNEQVLTDLVERLAQMQARRVARVRGGVSVPAQPIALRAEALYLPGEPVTLSVEAEGIERFGVPRARLTGRRLDFATRELPFTKSGDHWTLTLGELPAGQYALQVDSTLGGPGAPTPVHEVIEVAA